MRRLGGVVRLFDRSALAALLAWAPATAAQLPVGTAFTYQGRLTNAGAPANGNYDLEFWLFGHPTDSFSPLGLVTLPNVSVSGGLFTVTLDFFGGVFTGEARWLEIGVRPGGTSGPFAVLTPRQELMPTPNALYAGNAATVAGLTCANGQVAKWSGSTWSCGTDVDTDTNSGGTVTSVTAGSGLSGGTIMTSGTIAIATGGITSAMIANGAVGSAQIANGAVGSAQMASWGSDGTIRRCRP